jgi:large subunit ribosomal protein L30e
LKRKRRHRELDIEKAIRSAVDTGKVLFGERETTKAARVREIKLAIIADDCPRENRESLEKVSMASGVATYSFEGTGIELGSVCGKPFIVSMLGIIDAGDSDILEVGRR